MSDCSSPPSPSSMRNETRHNYVMLPNNNATQPNRMQVIRGPDGLLYAFTPIASPNATAASDYPIGSVLPRLNPGTAILPQGLNFPSPTAFAAAAAVAAGGQINIGALAAAATLQGQNPAANFPFIPIYAPFSMPPPNSQGGGISLQSFPASVPGHVSGANTQPLLERHSHKHETKSDNSSVSIQCLLAPNEAKLKEGRNEKSLSRSSMSPEPNSPPILSKTQNEHSARSWGTNANTSAMSLNKELISPTLISRTVPAVNLTQEPHMPHDKEKSAQENKPATDHSSAVTSEAISSFSSSTAAHSVRSLSSLSRYMNQVALPKQTAVSTGGTSSLEKLLKPNHKAREASILDDGVEENQSLSTHLAGEPHLMQFYDLFCKSQLSEHLRIRILATDGGTSVLKWVEVTRNTSHIEPDFGPLDAARILISSNGLCKLQLLFPYAKTLSTRFVPTTMAQANELFSELSPKHVICPGLPDCEEKLKTLGYQPTNVRVVETPGMKRYDHDKCPIWHIPLPCNLYSESGQIVHHMCKQCKNLLGTLNKTITKITSLNANSALRTGELLPSDLSNMSSAMSSGSLGYGISSPYLNRSPTSKVAMGQEGAKEGQGRKRKRKAQPKDKEIPVACSKKIEFPGIYQLLQTDMKTSAAAGGELPPPPTAMACVDSESGGTSTYILASSSGETAKSAHPHMSVVQSSSVIVDHQDSFKLVSSESSGEATVASHETQCSDDTMEATELEKDLDRQS